MTQAQAIVVSFATNADVSMTGALDRLTIEGRRTGASRVGNGRYHTQCRECHRDGVQLDFDRDS